MADTPTEIRFYRASERPYGCFSNLYRRPIMLDGETFPTAEHAYQAGKPRKPEVREWLLQAPSPSLLAMAAHGLYYWDVAPGWSRSKFDRMRRVLRAKFSQHPDLYNNSNRFRASDFGCLKRRQSVRVAAAGTNNPHVGRVRGGDPQERTLRASGRLS